MVDTYVRFKTQDSEGKSLESGVLSLESSSCTGCGACIKVCPLGAISLIPSSSSQSATRHRGMGDSRETRRGGDAESLRVPASPRPRVSASPLSYDVLVIGGGPAGSIAARTAAQQNVDVLMIEKRQEIGSPVRCAEGISKRVVTEFTELDPRWISAEINGGRIHAPDGNFVTIDEPGSGLVLERKIFDRELAAQAARAGAEVWVKARAVDLIKENGSIAGAVIRCPDGERVVRAKVVIAADGVESQVGKWAGIDTTCKIHEVDTCVQYLMTGVDIDSSYCDFYLGHRIAPRGYAWVFPKGDDSANVGIGIGGNTNADVAIGYLNRFVEKKLPGGSRAARLSMVVGCVPVGGTLPDFVRDGFMIIGDAAHQNDPVSGGGLANSMIAGQIAGEVAGQAVRNGDVSNSVLGEYETRWHEQIGRTFRHLHRLRRGILKFSDETLNNIAKLLLQTNMKELTLIDIFWTALRNDPRLLWELRRLISMGWAQ